jgi:hypothetical protein
LYNKTSELRQLEQELERLDPESPQYFLTAQRIQHLRTMLSTAEEQPSLRQLKESDQRLRELERAVHEPTRLELEEKGYDLDKLTLEQLAFVHVNVVTRLKAVGNERIWAKYQLARAQQALQTYQAELIIRPEDLELRSKIIEQEQKLQHLKTTWEALCQLTTTTTSDITTSTTKTT